MQQIITIYDYLLLPFYLLLFFFIIRKKAKKYQGSKLKRIFLIGFALHMAGSILHSLVIQYYYGYSDAFGFYLGGNVISESIKKDFSAFRYFFLSGKEIVNAATLSGYPDVIPVSMPNDSNASVMKISAIISFFTFNKYMIIALVLGFFSFIGTWKLFKVANEILKSRHTVLLAWGILYTPSIWFWSSGLLKESICFGCLGLVILYLYEIFVKKMFSLRKILLMFILLFILTTIKSYITAILFVSLFIALVFELIKKIKNLLLRYAVVLGLIILFINIFAFSDADIVVQDIITDTYSQIQMFQSNYEKTGEEEDSKGTIAGFLSFATRDAAPSINEILLSSPMAIFTCLYRPFLWESKKVIILFASLEATLTLFFTLFVLWKTRVYRFFIYTFSNFYSIFCFLFSIFFALVVGFTTYNFGTMVRYKIILLPFYFFLLVYVYDMHLRRKLTPAESHNDL